MAAAAKLVKSRFRCLVQIGPRAAMTLIAGAGAGLVDEVVMAGNAGDRAMILVRKNACSGGGRSAGCSRRSTPMGVGRSARTTTVRPLATRAQGRRIRLLALRGRHAVHSSASTSSRQHVTLLIGRSSNWPLPTTCAPRSPSSNAASTACVATPEDEVPAAAPRRSFDLAEMPVATSTPSAISAARPHSMYSGADGRR